MPAEARSARFDEKRARILAAATDVFATEGYDRASIRAVARRAKISVPGLYYYVASKEELLFQIQFGVFDRLVRRFKAEGALVPDPEARLELLVRNHLEYFLDHMQQLIVCSREIDRLTGQLGARLNTVRRNYFALCVRLFAELEQRHEVGAVDPRTAALALFGSINWIYTWYQPASGLSAERLAHQLCRLYLHGVHAEGRAIGEPGLDVE